MDLLIIRFHVEVMEMSQIQGEKVHLFSGDITAEEFRLEPVNDHEDTVACCGPNCQFKSEALE